MMEIGDQSFSFHYPRYLRYTLRGSMPAALSLLFLFSLAHGWSFHSLGFDIFCAVLGFTWWWVFRRYGLSVTVEKDGLRFLRGKTSTFTRWSALSAIRFSTSGVCLTADGKQWRIFSSLSDWDHFQRLLQEQAPSEALAAWLIPPFVVRAKWAAIAQPCIYCAAFLIAGISSLVAGQWKPALVMLGLGALFLFLLRRAVLWYRFGEDKLIIQRLTAREHYSWDDLQFATVKDTMLALSFAEGELIAIDAKHITEPIEYIFLSMERFWAKRITRRIHPSNPWKPIWSWPIALLWWTIIPVLVLVTFPAVIASIRAKLGAWTSVCQNVPTPEGLCQTLHHVTIFFYLDIAVLILMFIVVGVIHWTGEYCSRYPTKLLTYFRPTLVFAMASTIAIICTQSALLAALLYYVPYEFANLRLPGLLITVAIALIFGSYRIARAAFTAVRPAPLEVDAISVQSSEQPGIWELVTTISRDLGAAPPDNILLGLEPNYFATEVRINIGCVPYDGCSLYISSSGYADDDRTRASRHYWSRNGSFSGR
jgi:hypothetical protein